MAEFCAFFPWCDPDTFWDLDMREYVALAELMLARTQEG